MEIVKKSPGWTQYDRYRTVWEVLKISKNVLVTRGLSSYDEVKEHMTFECFSSDEYTTEIDEDIKALKAKVDVMERDEHYNMEGLLDMLETIEKLRTKCDKLSEATKAKCEQEDREIALRELLAQMIEAGDQLPEIMDSEKVKQYLQVEN